jgi:hypothetical protein
MSVLAAFFVACLFAVRQFALAQDNPRPHGDTISGAVMSPTAVDNNVTNPSFESGETPWILYNDLGIECDRIGNYKTATGVAAYDGTQYLWAGGLCNGVTQMGVNNAKQEDVYIPLKNPVLTFYNYLDRTDPDGSNPDDELAYVKLFGDVIWQKRLTRANNTNRWVKAEVDLSAYAGRTMNLKMAGLNGGEKAGGNVYYDQISIISGRPQLDPPSSPYLYSISNSDRDGSYSLSWSSVTGADSYQLQEQKYGGSWNTIYTGTNTSKSRSAQSAGTWCYRVRASNTAGDSPWSAT